MINTIDSEQSPHDYYRQVIPLLGNGEGTGEYWLGELGNGIGRGFLSIFDTQLECWRFLRDETELFLISQSKIEYVLAKLGFDSSNDGGL